MNGLNRGHMGQEAELSVITPGFHGIKAEVASAEGGGKQCAADSARSGNGPARTGIAQPGRGGGGQLLLDVQKYKQVTVMNGPIKIASTNR